MDPGRPAPGVLGIATLQITQIPFQIDQFGAWGNGGPGRHSSRSIPAPHQRAAPAMPHEKPGREATMDGSEAAQGGTTDSSSPVPAGTPAPPAHGGAGASGHEAPAAFWWDAPRGP